MAGNTQPIRPVVWWAVLGAAFVVTAFYVQGRWLVTGQAHHVGTGVTPEPLYAKLSVWGNEFLFGAGTLACVYFAAIRPKMRTGKIGFNGLLCLAFFFVWWQDCFFNYLTGGFAYNAEFINFGGWGPDIPGWSSPNGGQSGTPLIWNLGFYMFASFLLVLAASALMKRSQARWPRLKTSTMLAIAFVILFVADFAFEFFWVVTGLYSYGGTVKSWTLFSGHYYQFPIYEPLMAAVAFLVWICLIHFKNEQGQTVVERGLERVNLSHGKKQLLRFLALVAGLNICFLVSYDATINIWEHKIGTWPPDLEKRSYMVHGLCGPGTEVVCGQTTVRVGPNGTLVLPAHASVPTTVAFQR